MTTTTGNDTSDAARWVGATALACAVVSAVVALVPAFHFATTAPELRIALDSAQAMIGALVAYLLFGRFQRSYLWNHLAISYALALAAVTNLLLALLPSMADVEPGSRFVTWVPLALRSVSSLVLAMAALGRDRPWRGPAPGRTLLVALGGSVLVVGAAVAVLGELLPIGVRTSPATAGDLPRLDADPFLLAMQLVMVALYACAAVGFVRRARAGEGGLTLTFGVACAIAAFVRVNYFLYPSLYSDVVHIGDVFRLGFYLVLLVGATNEIRAFWLAQSEAAAISERQRLARDLHDGLAQDLAFIRSHTSSLAVGKGDPAMIEHVATAAQHALHESRRVVAALAAPVGGSLRDALDGAARSAATREGVVVSTDVPELDVPPHVREQLAWVTREAVGNAVRHGRARTVDVRAAVGSEGLIVEVVDDGDGFDAAAVGRSVGGVGLNSMRERLGSIGGTLAIVPANGTLGGMTVRATVPLRHRRQRSRWRTSTSGEAAG